MAKVAPLHRFPLRSAKRKHHTIINKVASPPRRERQGVDPKLRTAHCCMPPPTGAPAADRACSGKEAASQAARRTRTSAWGRHSSWAPADARVQGAGAEHWYSTRWYLTGTSGRRSVERLWGRAAAGQHLVDGTPPPPQPRAEPGLVAPRASAARPGRRGPTRRAAAARAARARLARAEAVPDAPGGPVVGGSAPGRRRAPAPSASQGV